MRPLDHFDCVIMAELQVRGDLPNVELARRLGFRPPPPSDGSTEARLRAGRQPSWPDSRLLAAASVENVPGRC